MRTEGERDASPALRARLLRAIFHRRFGSPARVLRWRVPFERQAANDDVWSNILESPEYFVVHIKLGLMEDYRSACQRQHRVLGHFLSIQAWLRGVECLVLDRRDVEAFLVLERLKKERINWLREDVQPWFPFQHAYERDSSGYSLHSIYVSRTPIEKWLPEGSMTTAARLAAMRRGSPKCEVFVEPPSGHRRLNELDVAKYVALLNGGLVHPEPLRSVPR
jgi:hypothetical protein